jgi:hypothetical protein
VDTVGTEAIDTPYPKMDLVLASFLPEMATCRIVSDKPAISICGEWCKL